ncbi:SRPBCC family protein [Streptomyces platensis]|uniref:SRPBCC family protein n=1 Tax=Streptomyces platensis TaxID=58346 RepID=UPI001F2D8408|nr:SRPBCC domain-containing protein [Streptomyces platensis]MCF3146039.1 SRPBCC domain-containing protein [Streptomyces platensis]
MTENPASSADAEGGPHGIALTRTFDARRELVFEAWTRPEHFGYWFGGELAVPADRMTMDARPGGVWSLVMQTPDGGELPFSGVYREVAPPERLEFTLKDASAPDGIEGEIVRVTLTDLGDRTEMAFRQLGGNLTSEQYRQAEAGWSGFFDRLAELLSQA